MTATIPRVIADFTTQLSTAISIGGTTFSLASILDDDGNSIPNGKYCFTIDNGSSGKEYLMGDMTAGVITNVVSVTRQGTESSGAVRQHRIGASVILTDFVVIQRLADILRGASALDGSSPLAYDTSPTLSSGLQLATVAYVLSVVTGGTVNFDNQVIAGVAGETVAAPNIAYLKEADARWWLSDADLTATFQGLKVGVIRSSAAAAAAVSVQLSGIASGFTGRTPGAKQYLSNTAGGVSETPGTNEFFIGWALTTTTILLAFNEKNMPTTSEKAALGGSTGTPGSTNKYVTQDNQSVATTDQSQATQNGTIETGEADTTTKKNLIAQSFIPTKTKIRGVKLYKAADSGAVTGTVVVTLQADTAGSPSGTPLATKTFTLLEWRNLAVGEINAIFSSEYASLTPGTLYWIVIDPSTSDNTNHVNFGTNTAGGYSSGSVKYKNTTDGWVAVSTIDLYFKTMEGNASQDVKTNTAGKIETDFYDVSEMPVPAFFQMLPLRDTTTAGLLLQLCSNIDGSVVIAATSGTSDLHRFQRDSVTGQYLETHTLNGSLGSTPKPGMVILGDYIYAFYDAGANMGCYRYLAADLSGEQAMTFGTSIATGGSNTASKAWTDGKYIYVVGEDSPNTVVKLSVSGTNFTQESTSTLEGTIDNTAFVHAMCDGLTVFGTFYSDPDITIYKLSDIDGTAAPTSTTTKKCTPFSNIAQTVVGLVNIDTTRIYMVVNFSTYSEAAQIRNFLAFLPIAKP